MRIIAGKLGGRQFESPRGRRTHPMSEKARGGLFSVLGDIEGLSVLDAFSGSGALAFEAISRGADHVIAIDIDKKATEIIKYNARILDVEEKIKVIRANASGWSDKNPGAVFDMVFIAPPYDDLRLDLVQKMTGHVIAGGTYILDWPGSLEEPKLEGLRKIHQKFYGDAQIVFYKK